MSSGPLALTLGDPAGIGPEIGEPARKERREPVGHSGDEDDPAHGLLPETAALHSGALEHLAVLLLRHPLAALLDH